MAAAIYITMFVVLREAARGESHCAVGYQNTCCLNEGVFVYVVTGDYPLSIRFVEFR